MEKIKINILNYFKDLEFDEKKHKYFINNKKIKISVSGLIKKFVEPFNKYAISLAISKRDNVLQKDILNQWKSKSDKACELGHITHKFGEVYPFQQYLKPTSKYEEAIVKFWNDLPKFVIPVVSELQMYHKKYLFAGTTDLLLYNTQTDTYIIGDYKTNENLFKNYNGKLMLYPFNNLLDNPYNHYQLQLSFYQILLEQTGINISSRKLIWLKPDGNYEMYSTDDYSNILKKYLESLKL